MLRNLSLSSKSVLIFAVFLLLCYSCSESNTNKKKSFARSSTDMKFISDKKIILNYPFGFDTINFPSDNFLTQARIELGKKIFFDTQFSADKKISCSSCHKPEFAFADTVKTHKGSHDSTNSRNSPSLINIGFHPYFNYDGGVSTLEKQVFVPFDGETEMHSNLVLASDLMKKDKKYVDLAMKAYKRKPDPFVIVRALASFQRSIISSGSKYDLYKKTNNKKGLTAEEIKGMNLFFSTKTNCSKCHSGPLFTNFKFENIGLPNNSNDSGRKRVTLKPLDVGKFKTPALRNVSKTFPYMHDGSINSLSEVIEFYNEGGIIKTNKSEWIKPLNLTEREKKAIISFLKTLSDTI